MQKLDDGGYAINDSIDIPSEGVDDFIFARGWLLEIVELYSGDYYFISGGQVVRPQSNRFGVFYPPFTFVRAFARNMKGKVTGVGSEEVDPELPSVPFMFEATESAEFTATSQAAEILEKVTDRRSIAVSTDPSIVTRKAKRLIDENYLVYPSIARIARRLKISHEHLSRQFKKDLGISPSAYLHKLRVADATHRLALGQEIVDISMDVGYNDLSRFYKQFRKATRTSPAACRKQVFD